MDIKGEVLLQLLNKSKLRNGTKMFLEPKFFSIIDKFKKLGFSVPLSHWYIHQNDITRNFAWKRNTFTKRVVSKSLLSYFTLESIILGQ